MVAHRVRIAGVAAQSITCFLAVLLLTYQPLRAQQPAVSEPRPCRITFDEATSGGDIQTQRGEIVLSGFAPQRDGSFVMTGTGVATATYEAVGGCRVVAGSPFTVRMFATLQSNDGKTADIDIAPMDTSGSLIKFRCPRGDAETTVYADGIPTVTLPLEDGAATTYKESSRVGGISGSVTLQLCGAPAVPGAGGVSLSQGGGGASGPAAVPVELCDRSDDRNCPAAENGITYRVVARGDEGSSEARVWVAGRSARTEYVATAGNPFMPRGGYLLSNDRGVFLVDPSRSTFARFDMTMMQELAGGLAAPGGAGAIQIDNVSVEKIVDAPGETIQGYPTRHYQLRSIWTMGMSGAPMTTEFTTIEDVWTTNRIEAPSFASGIDGDAVPEAVRQIAAAENVTIEGFPLRRVTVQSSKIDMGGLGPLAGFGTRRMERMVNRASEGGRRRGGAQDAGDPPGDGRRGATTTEVFDIEEVSIPLTAFEVPPGYRETQLFQQGPALPSLNDIPAEPKLPSLNEIR